MSARFTAYVLITGVDVNAAAASSFPAIATNFSTSDDGPDTTNALLDASALIRTPPTTPPRPRTPDPATAVSTRDRSTA